MNIFPVPADCAHPAPYCAEEQAFRDSRFMDAYVVKWVHPNGTSRCARRMDWAADLGLRDRFGGEFPKTYQDVLDAISTKA